MGKGSLDIFVSESHSYEDRFLFTYTPRNPGSRFDCYMSYEFREDGNSLENVSEKFYGNVSVENPIVLEFPRILNSYKTLLLKKPKLNKKDKSLMKR